MFRKSVVLIVMLSFFILSIPLHAEKTPDDEVVLKVIRDRVSTLKCSSLHRAEILVKATDGNPITIHKNKGKG